VLKSDYNWIRTVINKGTVSDRIAAHTIAIQDSPVHTQHLLHNLISMVKVNKKKECVMVLGKNHPVLRYRANSSFCQKAWYKQDDNVFICFMLVLFTSSHSVSLISILILSTHILLFLEVITF
jgi:hypothetical protein